MNKQTRSAAFICGAIALVLTACAPTATNKPDNTASANRPADAGGADKRAGEGQRGGTKEADTGASS